MVSLLFIQFTHGSSSYRFRLISFRLYNLHGWFSKIIPYFLLKMPLIIFILSINIHSKYLLLDIELITICKFCPSFICISFYMLFPPSRNILAHVRLFGNPKDCSLPGSSVSKRGFSRQEYCKWFAISSSRGSSRPRDSFSFLAKSSLSCRLSSSEKAFLVHKLLWCQYFHLHPNGYRQSSLGKNTPCENRSGL